MDNPFNSNGVDGGKALVGESGIKIDKGPYKIKYLDDEVSEDMQPQMHMPNPFKGKNIEEITEKDLDRIITPQHKESIKKIEELLDD